MVERRINTRGACPTIRVEDGGSMDLLLHTDTTCRVEICVGVGATLNVTQVEEDIEEAIECNLIVTQKANSRLTHMVVTRACHDVTNHLEVRLEGEGAECECNGCVILRRDEHVENHTLIRHIATHCTSNELYKYLLTDSSRGTFFGKVLVAQGAQKTSSSMRNQNLCATREARMDTQPILEIYADDVKCQHGATIGQMDDAALFYMAQRGISLPVARQLLQAAFLFEVVSLIRVEEVRERVTLSLDHL